MRMTSVLARARANAEPPAAEGHVQSYAANRLLDFARGGNAPRNEKRPACAPKILLVPVTLSSGSCPALAIARNLACESKARLVLLHVVQLNIAGEERGIPRTRLLDELARSREIQLRELANGLGGQAAAEILVCQGHPAGAIVETARRLQADAIVMRAHGHCGWLQWLHRNTARNVVRQAPCRIWLVCPGNRAESVNLVIVDPTKDTRPQERAAFHEKQSPLRSLLRVPFS